MLLSRRSRGQEVTGPTPHSVAARAKLPLSRPADHLTLERQKQDATRDEVLEFTRYQQTCDIKNSWLQSSERHFLRRADQRHVLAAVRQHESGVEERKDRFPLCLFLFQAKMREKPKALRGRRESERQQLVSDKLEQLFREQCEELRTVESRRCEQQVSVERAAQVRSQRERRQLQRQEDQLFDELWEADRRAKEEQEDHRMEATELQRVEEKELREEEARLTQEVQRLQKQREQLHKLQTQQATRRQLDRGFRLKMQRLAREQQEELQLDMSILQQLLQQETDQRQEAAQRKVELREEQQRYRQYLSEELQKQRREEEETEQLMEEKLKETWTKREEQSRLQREARNQLMNEVMEARHLQIQHKRKKTRLSQTELAREREELNRLVEESRVKDEEEKRRRTCEAYQADLRAQIRHRQQLRSEDRAQAQREIQQGLILQQLYDQKKDEILSRPTSHTVAPHPFRRAQGSRSAPQHRLT
uniref:Trichohyalin-plectin-homology domain-containing protein n=1 Tax=Monopterus albus TaxID=43700 RepID=A0A3Q3JGI3_MONAL